MTNVAFIGLGTMGFPMAGHLQRNGHQTTVYNRNGEKAKNWQQEYGGDTADTPALAAKNADIVFSCVGNDDDVRGIALGENGIFAGLKQGAIWVDHTTASANIAREMAVEAKNHGVKFMDAPVSGGQAGAENGVLTVMCGGDDADFKVAQPIMDVYARAVTLMGPHGSGQLTKMANQIAIAGLVQALSESIHFAKRAGLDIPQLVDVISKGAAGSWQMENRGVTMGEGKFDFGFALDWMRKDLGICLSESKNNGAQLPVTALVDQFYATLQQKGHGRWDTSSLIHLLEER